MKLSHTPVLLVKCDLLLGCQQMAVLYNVAHWDLHSYHE